ncbi:hypothetical protein CVT26_012899 [Gymnopilus dilepis]|uniref:Uncharacterized protein n=1 Tax=Gymnopilus dilepis TaxID=231916 RepID=A0A409WD62_9AGAR|nr:hypothetical protein CVT26_012899 [Gymnopilus dilepis]
MASQIRQQRLLSLAPTQAELPADQRLGPSGKGRVREAYDSLVRVWTICGLSEDGLARTRANGWGKDDTRSRTVECAPQSQWEGQGQFLGVEDDGVGSRTPQLRINRSRIFRRRALHSRRRILLREPGAELRVGQGKNDCQYIAMVVDQTDLNCATAHPYMRFKPYIPSVSTLTSPPSPRISSPRRAQVSSSEGTPSFQVNQPACDSETEATSSKAPSDTVPGD